MLYSSSTNHAKPFSLVLGIAFALIIMTVLVAAIASGGFDLRSKAGYESDCRTSAKNLACPSGYSDKRNPKQNVWVCCKPVNKPTSRPQPSATPRPTITGSLKPSPTPIANACAAQGGQCKTIPSGASCSGSARIQANCPSGQQCVKWYLCTTLAPTMVPETCGNPGDRPFHCTGTCRPGRQCTATSSYICECK